MPAKRTTVYLDPELHKAIKIKAIYISSSVSDLLNNAIKKGVSERGCFFYEKNVYDRGYLSGANGINVY